LFELNRFRGSAFGPQASGAFAAKGDARMCFPRFDGGLAQTVDRVEKPRRFKRLLSIQRQVRLSLNGGVNVHTLRAQSMKKTLPVRLRGQDERGIGGVHGGSHKSSQAIDDSGVI
jgi:hypothetical protein